MAPQPLLNGKRSHSLKLKTQAPKRQAPFLAACLAAALFLLNGIGARAATYTWSGTANGNWTDVARWGSTLYPDGVGDVANITTSSTTAKVTTQVDF